MDSSGILLFILHTDIYNHVSVSIFQISSRCSQIERLFYEVAIISLSNQTLGKYNVSSNVCNGEICSISRTISSKHSGYIITLRAMNDFGVSSTSYRIANLSSGKRNYKMNSCNSNFCSIIVKGCPIISSIL